MCNLLMTENYYNSLKPYQRRLMAIESQFDSEFAYANLQFDFCFEKYMLEIKNAEQKLILESVNENDLMELYVEAKNKTKPKLVDSIKKMIDSIINFLNNTIDLISEKIDSVVNRTNVNNITADDFRNSKMNNLMVSMDYDKKMKNINKHLGLGKQLFRKACRINGVSDIEIEGYAKASKELLKEIPEFTCRAVPHAIKAGGVIILAKNYGKILTGIKNGLKNTADSMNVIKSSVQDVGADKQKVILEEMGKLTKSYNKIASKISLSICATMNAINRDKK